MITLVKIGGSLITDKTREKAFRQPTASRLAREVREVLDQDGTLRLVIGHGSGSFGHYAADRYHTMRGVSSQADWIGFAEVAAVASELSCLVAATFQEVGVPVWRLQPSASAQCEDGVMTSMNTDVISTAIEKKLIPLVHGDVSLDVVRGGTIISTETIFKYLAQKLPVTRIILLGEVAGVYDTAQHVIPKITPQNYSDVADALGGSRGTDVTGGMLSKVQDMLSLVQSHSSLEIRIADGRVPNLLQDILLGDVDVGTRISDS